MNARVAVVVGAGPGLGVALARRFAKEGFSVALLGRSLERLEPLAASVRALGNPALAVSADVSDEASLRAAIERARHELGEPEALLYNAGAYQLGGVLDITPDDLMRAFKVTCLGALIAAQAVLPSMVAAKRGSILLTGATASLRGSAKFAAIAVPKFGLRALGQSLAREFGPQGIHVAHVVCDGPFDTDRVKGFLTDRDPETMLSPDAMADVFWSLHAQDKRAWTQELDVRTNAEKW